MNKNRKGYLLFIIWCLVAVVGMYYHEMWRDEMRALSIAIQSPHLASLPHSLINEGHPILWYFVLKVFYSIFHTAYILPVLSFLVAAGIAWFFLIRSPFPLIFSVLIIFGPWCLYDYGINCRNYGIGALLFLVFADLYSRQPNKIILSSIVLALAAQSNVYSAMMAVLISCWVLTENFIKGGEIKKSLIGLSIIGISFLFVAYVTMPDSNSIVLVNEQQKMDVIYKIWDVGHGFTELLYLPFPYTHGLLTGLLWISLFVFLTKPRVFAFLLITLMVMSFFALYYRLNFIQHQGIWIYTYLIMVWINFKEIRGFLISNHWSRYLGCLGVFVFSFILTSNVCRSVYSYYYDIIETMSDAKDAGKWFDKNIKSTDIIIAEPDYIMESVMYYHYHPYYIPREKLFNTYVHFTKANSSVMTLSKLEQIADSFFNLGKTTYLVLGKNFESDTVYKYSYNKQYIVDSMSLSVLKKNYQLLNSFNQNWVCDEQYYIFKRKLK